MKGNKVNRDWERISKLFIETTFMLQKGKVTSYRRKPLKRCFIKDKTHIFLFKCKGSCVEAQYSGEILGCHLELSNQRKAKKKSTKGVGDRRFGKRRWEHNSNPRSPIRCLHHSISVKLNSLNLGILQTTNSLTLLKLAGGASKFGGTGEMNFGHAYEKASSNICTSLKNEIVIFKCSETSRRFALYQGWVMPCQWFQNEGEKVHHGAIKVRGREL